MHTASGLSLAPRALAASSLSPPPALPPPLPLPLAPPPASPCPSISPTRSSPVWFANGGQAVLMLALDGRLCGGGSAAETPGAPPQNYKRSHKGLNFRRSFLIKTLVCDPCSYSCPISALPSSIYIQIQKIVCTTLLHLNRSEIIPPSKNLLRGADFLACTRYYRLSPQT